jgi:subtilisin family serine protease
VLCRQGLRAYALAATLISLVCVPVAQAASKATPAASAHRTAVPAVKAPVAPPTQWALSAIGAPTVWADGGQGQGVTVAIVDSGANLSQRDIAPNLWVNPGEVAGNGIDDDNDGYVDDVNGYDFVANSGTPTDQNGHGTHVAGIVAGSCKQICGVAPRAKLMIVRVLDSQAQGDAGTVALGVRFAVDHGAHIINLSLAGPDADPQLEAAIAYAAQAGDIVVTAAGNGAQDMDTTPSYPASFESPNLISVAATGMDGRLGAESDYGSSVDIAAPGQAILSTSITGGEEWRTGTSMASPMVAGALADLWSLDPTATWQQLRASVLTSAVRGVQIQTGTLNIPAALSALTGVPVKPAAKAKKATPKKATTKKSTKKASSKTKLRTRSSVFVGV